MLRRVTEYSKRGAKCGECRRVMDDPQTGRDLDFCCGRDRTWFDILIDHYDVDDGRDEKGRFHHRPTKTLLFGTIIHGGD